MWNQAAPASLPDSFEDEYALEIVYDAPEEQAAEQSVEEAAPRRGSAVKARKGRPAAQHSPSTSQAGSPYSGSPRAGAGGTTAAATGLLAQEVHTLLQAVTQRPPILQQGQQQQQQQQESEEQQDLGQPLIGHVQQQGQGHRGAGDGARARAAASQAHEPSQQQQQQTGPGSAGSGAALARRPRQPPMHNSPAVPAPPAALPSGQVTGADQGPRSGGRRWRPAAKAADEAEPSRRPSSRVQPSGQLPAVAGTRPGVRGPFGGGWAAADANAGFVQPTAQLASSQAPRDAVQRRAEPAALAASTRVGAGGGGGGGAGFFDVDEDLLAAHMNMPPPEAAAGGGGWRHGGKRGKQPQQAQQQQHPPQRSQMGQEDPRGASWGGASQAVPAAGLGALLGRQGAGDGGNEGPGLGTQGGAARNPLAALLPVPGAGTRLKAPATAPKKKHPIYGTGPAAQQQAKQLLTSPRQQRHHAHFSIKEAPSPAPYGGSGSGIKEQQAAAQAAARGAEGAGLHSLRPQQAQQAQRAQQAGVGMGMQELIGRVPGSSAWDHPAHAAVLEGIDAGDDGWLQEERGRWQGREQEQEQRQDDQGWGQGASAHTWGKEATPGQGLQAHPAASAGGHENQPWGGAQEPGPAGSAPPGFPGPAVGAAAPPATSYKTPAHQLRQLFHRGTTPGSSATPADQSGSDRAGASTGPWAAAAPPGAAGSAAGRLGQAQGAGAAGGGGVEGGSAGKGMSLQRQFVAALAPVSRPTVPPRGGCVAATAGGLYGRLQAVAGAEKAHLAQQAQHGGRAGAPAGGPPARLTVLERENEANLTKCLCRLELLPSSFEGTAGAAGGAAAGGHEGTGAGVLASAGTVVALFQSRTAREVDLVPGSAVLVRAGAWRAMQVAGCELPVMLCHAAMQA